jgi:predicted nucleotidyltransferase
MDGMLKQKLKDKNEKLIKMVIERVKRDFPDDIAIIGLTGSFSTDDYHEKSDLDLIIINNTGRGWGISTCFILEDVGYDIYCTPWEALKQRQTLRIPVFPALLIYRYYIVLNPIIWRNLIHIDREHSIPWKNLLEENVS